jgi:hypothetical protein
MGIVVSQTCLVITPSSRLTSPTDAETASGASRHGGRLNDGQPSSLHEELHDQRVGARPTVLDPVAWSIPQPFSRRSATVCLMKYEIYGPGATYEPFTMATMSARDPAALPSLRRR